MYRRRMHAEGGRVVHREKRTRKLAVVVALQNLLVAACLLVTLYVYCYRDDPVHHFPEDIHIGFLPIADITGQRMLQFNVDSQHMMNLTGEKQDKICINCSGPYILYMEVCYKSLLAEETSGTLYLQVQGSNVSSFRMNASTEVCRGLHSIAYLKAKDEANLYLDAAKNFKIKNVTVGLKYLLGRCEV